MKDDNRAPQIAPCGLDCAKCPSLEATQKNDRAALRKIADRWTGGKPGEKLAVEFIMCDGCISGSARMNSYCHVCRIRICALEKGVVTCAECDSYPCEILNAFPGYYDEGKVNLEEIRASRPEENTEQ